MSVLGLTSGIAGAPPSPAEILRHAISVITTSRGGKWRCTTASRWLNRAATTVELDHLSNGGMIVSRVLTKCFREPRKLVGVIEDMRKTLCFRSFFSPTARR